MLLHEFSLLSNSGKISVQTVYEECGLLYAAIYRNSNALVLMDNRNGPSPKEVSLLADTIAVLC